MKATDITFETKDVIKLVGFVAIISGMWYDIKGDLRVFKATTELRIGQLEKSNERTINMKPQRFAVMPNETKIEDEGN